MIALSQGPSPEQLRPRITGALNPDCPGVILILSYSETLDDLLNFSVYQFSDLSSGAVMVPNSGAYCGNSKRHGMSSASNSA